MTLKQKKYLLIALWTILLLFIFFLVVFPLIKEINKTKKDLQVQGKELALFQERNKALQAFQQKYYKKQETQLIHNFFVNPGAPVAFISFLEKTAQQVKVKLEISPLPLTSEEKKEKFPPLRFLLKGEGAFPNFYQFLAKVEKAPYLTTTERVELQKVKGESREGKKEEKGKLNFTLTLKVYAKAK